MSNDEIPRTDSVDLLSYLKEEIPIEDIRDYASPQRIESIDFVKGLAMVFIIIAHAAGAWLDNDWVYIYGMVYSVLDILGPSLFIFLSALSVIFSIKRKKGKLPEKVIRARILTRGVVIMLIGMLYNILAAELVVPGYPFPLNLWGWNILMFIGFSQIASYYALKLKKVSRLVLGLTIILLSPLLRGFLYSGKDVNIFIWILHYFVTSPAPQVTFLPWVAVCFFSTIFGEYLFDVMNKGEEFYPYLLRIFLFWGIVLVLIGLFMPLPQIFISGDPMPVKMAMGIDLATEETMPYTEYLQIELLAIMNQQYYYQFPGMPIFLVRGSSSSMFYNLGAALLIIGICFYLIDMKKIHNDFVSMLKYYGKVSLSLFLIHYIFIPVYIRSFNIVFFPFIVLSYIGFYGFLMFIWMEAGDGAGSPEWFMIQLGRIGEKTGESVAKGTKKVAEKTKEGFKKLEEGIKEGSKKIAEKTKETFKKKKDTNKE